MKKRRTKLKTRKSASRRFKVTATGKILRRTSFRSHLASNKSKRARRNKVVKLIGANRKKIKKILQI
ncbi:50S ribosomal protein L35 [Candidatus Microgenomates bacterium]|nr:50S ribosomal protein L35 [Candidatus Microgenomates bacterium]